MASSLPRLCAAATTSGGSGSTSSSTTAAAAATTTTTTTTANGTKTAGTSVGCLRSRADARAVQPRQHLHDRQLQLQHRLRAQVRALQAPPSVSC
jgi:hypothetical protein